MLPLKPGLLIFCVAIAILHPSWTQKIQTTRTALHVARSLDPDSMESVPVKTRAGDLTTIIVKKRQEKSSNVTEPDTNSTNYVLLSSSNVNTDNTANKTHQSSKIEQIIAIPYDKYNASHISASQNYTTSQNRTDRSNLRVPEPVYVSSSMVYVKNELSSPSKKGRSLVKMDADGIPVVTGVRVPDDDSDRQVWRNARVINGILVPYEKSDKDIVTKSKPSRKPSTMKPTEDMWTKIGTVTKKPTKLSPAVQIMKQDSWNDPKWDLFKRPVTLKPIVAQSTSEPQVLQTIETSDNADRSRPSYTQHPLGLWMPADTDENPEHKYVTDRILEYIRNINKEEMKRLSMQKFTVRDARMLSTASPLQEQPQIQSRILHVPGASVFPNSAMYSASTQAPSRVSFEEGVRTPVLQYAHPELGVQAAKAEPTQGEIMDKKESSYYPEDIHADRGPFVFEPAAPAEQAETEAANNQRSHTAAPSYFQRPKKTLAYFYPEKQVYAPNKYYGKYPPIKDDYKLSEYPTIYYEDMDGRPFWIRFGDSLKEQVQTGIDKVTDLTRPVMEPLVEATQKISQNLGFSGNRDMSTIREKLGTVSTSSLILPAIGIVAGGAALGLGAVAVGRYLNYDVVKMRSGKSLNLDQLQIPDPSDTKHLENLWAEDNSRSASESTSTSSEAPTTKSRRRRSISKIQNSDIYLENVLQTLDSNQEQPQVDVYPSSVWGNTPCSKRIFCEAMLLQPEDSISLMDKKIFTFLSLIHPDIAATVAPHLEDVMRSVKMKNCSIYSCSSWKHSHKPEVPVNNT